MAKARRSGVLLPAVIAAGGSAVVRADRALGDQALQAFVDAIGGRQALIQALEVGAQAAAVDQVLSLLSDPRYQQQSLRWICEKAGLTAAELFAAFRTAKLAEAQIRATVQIAERIGPVVEDLLRRAAPYEGTCGVCEGTGTTVPKATKTVPNPEPEPCRVCQATGRVTYLPELERQKVALDLAELVKKGGGGISITQQQLNLGAAAGTKGGDLERLQQALSGAWDPDPPEVIDADPVTG